MRWYRAYVGTTTDKKLGAIGLRAGVSRSVVVAAWHVILESAADANAGGKCQCDEFDVSAALNEPLDAIQRVMVCFAEANVFRDGEVQNWIDHVSYPRLPESQWGPLRSAVFERDDYTCRYCGARGVRLECDHVLPVARGGGHSLDNLTTACRTCNRLKRDKTPEEWGRP